MAENKKKVNNSNLVRFRADPYLMNMIKENVEKHHMNTSAVIKMLLNNRFEEIEKVKSQGPQYIDKDQADKIMKAVLDVSNALNLYNSRLKLIERDLNRIGTNSNMELRYKNELNIPTLPVDAIEKQIEEFKQATDQYHDAYTKFGETLLWLLQR